MENSISFPRLGIALNVNQVAFQIGPKPIYWYAIIIMSGFILSLLVVHKTCKKRGVNPENVFDVALYGLVFGVICARIYYCIFDPDCLDGNILNVIKIWEGGIAIYGAIIGAILSTVIYCKVKKLNIFKVLDVMSPGMLLGQSIGRWGNFVNCEVFGRTTNSLFGMSINNLAPVHPLFLYESSWNLLGFILIMLFRDKKHTDGQVFFAYILWYSVGRICLEGMRQSEYVLYVIKDVLGISQLVAFFGIVASIFGIVYLEKKKNQR